jgi:hypothetical protein
MVPLRDVGGGAGSDVCPTGDGELMRRLATADTPGVHLGDTWTFLRRRVNESRIDVSGGPVAGIRRV